MDSLAKTLDGLRDAVADLRKAVATVVATSPTAHDYNQLAGDASPFFAAIVQAEGIDVSDSDVKRAVCIKEMYDSGALDFLKRLLEDGDEKASVNDLIKELNNATIANSSQWVSKEKKQAETTTKSGSGVAKLERSVSTPSNKPINAKFATDILPTSKTPSALETTDETAATNSPAAFVNFYDLSQFQHAERMPNGCTVDFPDNLHKRERNHTLLSTKDLPQPPAIHDSTLLHKIFTHQSIVNNIYTSEGNKVQFHNERVEFLGDAFLQFLVSVMVYERFPLFSEGQMSLLRSSIVSNKNLLEWSKLYKFDKALKKNFNDNTIGGDKKVYADVFEAYLGGLVEQYMMETDDGLTNMSDFMKCWFDSKGWIEALAESKIQSFDQNLYDKMQYSKSAKQDIRTLIGQINVPDYIRVDLGDHTFLSCVKIQNKVYGYGVGTSYKEADARAATDAMKNPCIRDICPKDMWARYEDSLGLNDKNGLNFTECSKQVRQDQLERLTKEILIKYKNGDFKLLNSENNPHELVIDQEVRSEFNQEIKTKYAINEETIDDDVYYSPIVTRGRGGVFNEEEAKRVKKRREKSIKGGITRNLPVRLDDGSNLLCHEVLISPDTIDRDSKNKVHSVFHKRGSLPDYRMYRTDQDFYLCELWYGSEQIVSYGLARTKQDASQLAAQLAFVREEYFGYDDDL